MTHQPRAARDVLVYFIHGAKERAPAAAMAFLVRLGAALGDESSPLAGGI